MIQLFINGSEVIQAMVSVLDNIPLNFDHSRDALANIQFGRVRTNGENHDFQAKPFQS